MTNRSISAGRYPRDMQARERLRHAQRAETRAVGAVSKAQEVLAAASRKRDTAVVASDAIVVDAERSLAVAQAQLVKVSGIDRACALLGVTRATLRKARVAAASTYRADGDDGRHHE
jgi:hypothetical protein